MRQLPFIKMHGLGNDFVIIDGRNGGIVPDAAEAARIADRRRGVGCDQIIVVEPAPAGDRADAVMRILNADGSEVGACGNATRCVVRLLHAETGTPSATIKTRFGWLDAVVNTDGRVTVDMGSPCFHWQEIPLAREMDTAALDYGAGSLSGPGAVNVGNPHVVFAVEDVEAVDVAEIGRAVEIDPLFPERTNVEFCQVLAPDRVRMRVWERGVGITQACGSGACATVVALARQGKLNRAATVVLDGGDLDIAWTDDDRVLMTGPTAESFRGVWATAEAAE